jgi:hypothetical protein
MAKPKANPRSRVMPIDRRTADPCWRRCTPGWTTIWYSVVATPQANGWEPYHYLRRGLSDIPRFLQADWSLESLPPWNLAPTTRLP